MPSEKKVKDQEFHQVCFHFFLASIKGRQLGAYFPSTAVQVNVHVLLYVKIEVVVRKVNVSGFGSVTVCRCQGWWAVLSFFLPQAVKGVGHMSVSV